MGEEMDSFSVRSHSDNLVDLHVSVVPMKHWVEKLNYASHKVISDTFSAGFIRVLPETTIAKLRSDIEEQLGREIFPRDYVFLKHIGRCLALVRQSQEKQLKVKNFLPPHSIMPEIYILPGQPAMYSYTVLPPIKPRLRDLHNSLSDTDGNLNSRHTSEHLSDSSRMPSFNKFNDVDSLSASYNNSPKLLQNKQLLRQSHLNSKSEIGKVSQPRPGTASKTPLKSRTPTPRHRKPEDKRQQRHVSGKSSYDIDVNLTNSTSYIVTEERGRTTPGQALDAPSSERSYSADGDHLPDAVILSQKIQEDRRPSQAKSVLRDGPKKRKVRYNMPSTSDSNTSSPGTKWITLSDSDPQKPGSANNDSGFVDHEHSDSDESIHRKENKRRSLSIDADSDVDVREEVPLTLEGTSNQRYSMNQRTVKTPNLVVTPRLPTKELKSDESHALALPSSQQISVVRRGESEIDDRIKPVKEIAHGDAGKSETALQNSDRAKLWEDLQKIRSERRKMEKERQELVKQAKATTSKINQKRSSVRDMWKKKFFEEKKRTMPLEETCRRLQGELDSSHRRLVSALEGAKPGETKKFVPVLPPPIHAPSTKVRRKSIGSLRKNNNRIQATRLQHDMDSLRRKIEDSKIKLTGEIKLRHQAEQDVKTIRQELLSKKIRAHIAYRELQRGNPYSVKG